MERRNHIRLGTVLCPVYSEVWLKQVGIMKLGKAWLCQCVCSARHGTNVADRFLPAYLLLGFPGSSVPVIKGGKVCVRSWAAGPGTVARAGRETSTEFCRNAQLRSLFPVLDCLGHPLFALSAASLVIIDGARSKICMEHDLLRGIPSNV